MLRRVLDKKGGGYDMTEPRKRGTYVIDSYLCDVQFKGVVILLRHFLFTSVAWLTLTVVRECCLSRLNLSTTSVISGTSSTLNSTISDVFRNFKWSLRPGEVQKCEKRFFHPAQPVNEKKITTVVKTACCVIGVCSSFSSCALNVFAFFAVPPLMQCNWDSAKSLCVQKSWTN